MGSCLLCLEFNKELLETIKADSLKWQELNIKNIIEKHFWPISAIQNAWICLTCWKEVDNFHRFYMCIEEAHAHFGSIKVERDEEITIKKAKTIKSEDADTESFGYCFLEPEILIDQPKPVNIDQESPLIAHANEIGIDGIPLKNYTIECEDPLVKSKKPKLVKLKNKESYEKQTTDNKTTNKNEDFSNVKDEPNTSDSNKSNDNDSSDANYQQERESTETVQCKKRKYYSKQQTNRKENDKFISEHYKQIFCDLCNVPFQDFPAMRKHFTDTHQQRGYVVCCSRKFFNRTCLVDHLHCHLNPDHFKCVECGTTMSNRKSFRSHMLHVHRSSRILKQHFCGVCGKSFTKPSLLKIHELTHLPEEEKKFPCEDCGKNYGSPHLLNQHRQAVHLKRFVKICYICGKSINNSAEFKAHMNKHEGIPAPVINCDVCGLRLTSERGLKLHKESQHPVGGKREHPCPICPKVSPTLKALKKHINTMHEKGYDHKCSICEKAFKRAEALKEHMASHTGNTLYTCPWCPKTFNSNGNMHAHRKKIHPKEWEETKMQKYATHTPNAAEF